MFQGRVVYSSAFCRGSPVCWYRKEPDVAGSFFFLFSSHSHSLKCLTFSLGCVIQCGNTLCSPGEHKQLPALLIYAGALNSFCSQHLSGVIRREIICLWLPAEQLILLAVHSCCLQHHSSATGWWHMSSSDLQHCKLWEKINPKFFTLDFNRKTGGIVFQIYLKVLLWNKFILDTCQRYTAFQR